MTAMLKPPVQMVRDLGWRQVLGLDQADDGFWAEVRGQQLRQLNRNVPFNIGLLTINLVTVLAAFGDVVAFSALAPWLGGIGGLAVFWTLRAIRLRPGHGTPQASQSLYWRVTAEIAALALFWAGLLHALAPALPADSQAVMMLFSLIFSAQSPIAPPRCRWQCCWYAWRLPLAWCGPCRMGRRWIIRW
jgi:hypothetical protein